MSTTKIPRWTLGDRLRKARVHAHITVEQMAAEIGRTERTIRNYEKEATPVPKLVVDHYADSTKVPLLWILNGREPDPGPDGLVTTGYTRHLVAA